MSTRRSANTLIEYLVRGEENWVDRKVVILKGKLSEKEKKYIWDYCIKLDSGAFCFLPEMVELPHVNTAPLPLWIYHELVSIEDTKEAPTEPVMEAQELLGNFEDAHMQQWGDDILLSDCGIQDLSL